jgi:hypothetical protein
MSVPDLKSVKFDKPVTVTAGGGSQIFGNTVISWVPSTTAASVQVTVTMGGMQIQQSTLTPGGNQMSYNATSGKDTSQGALQASFGPTGMSGSLYGSLTWTYQGGSNNYSGQIGTWGN